MNKAYISLGSNLGDRLSFLRGAVHALASLGSVSLLSPIYETAPIGYLDQPAFLNMTVLLNTALLPFPLLQELLWIEHQFGRTRTVFQGPRTLDLDLLFYNDLVLTHPFCTLPHPRLHERLFVLEPLRAIAPDHIHPTLYRSIEALYVTYPSKVGVTLFSSSL